MGSVLHVRVDAAEGRCRPRKPDPERKDEMRLFKRKPVGDEVPRCPDCAERIPDGAVECAMCGRDLRDLIEVVPQGDAAGVAHG